MLKYSHFYSFSSSQFVSIFSPTLYQPVRRFSNYKRRTKSVLPRDDFILQFKSRISQNKSSLSPEEWRDIRQQAISNSKQIKAHNIDAVILSQFNEEDLEIAKSYLTFLEEDGIEANYAALGKLLKLYHMVSINQGISEEDKESALQIYKKIRAKHDVLDATTCENLIFGLLSTDNWRDSVELLKMIKFSASPSMNVYSYLISRAFAENEMILGWDLLNEMVEARKQPKCEVFIAYLHTISKDDKTFVHSLEKLFNFLGNHEILVSRKVVLEMRTCLQEKGFSSTSLTTLNANGKCKACQTCMRNISITNEEFNELSSAFLERVLIRKDVFLKSTPDEVEKFIKFVDETGPYDCVIDGLNVAYSCGAKKGPKVYVHLLSSVVRYFQRQNKYVLVLGRQHMHRWPKEGMNYIKKNARTFFANDLSHDDPFLLYATIKSGPSTDFFSRDLMRSHAFLLGTKLKSIFRRWQQEHQYSLVTASDVGKVVVKEPIRHIKYAHEVNSTWHIPFKEIYSANPPEMFEVPNSWLCIKLNKVL